MARLRKKHEEKEVDLAALVDIFSNMLFFLLATVSFLQLKTLNAAVPALTAGPPTTMKSVNVTVTVTAGGYLLQATGEAADPNTKFQAVNMEIPRVTDAKRCEEMKSPGPPCLDSATLTKQLWEIKKITPETKNIMISPEQGILFEDIVKTMDASREMVSIIDPNKKVPLFTRPVLIETVTGDEQARDDVK